MKDIFESQIEKNNNIVGVKNHKNDSKFLVSLILFLLVILFISTTFVFRESLIASNELDDDQIYRNYASQLMRVSDYLTNRVYYYVVTGEKKYLDEYYAKLKECRDDGLTTNSLLAYAKTEKEIEILENTIMLSKRVGITETEAFDLMAQGKIEEAQKLIFTTQYVADKEQMQINNNERKAIISSRVSEESEFVLQLSKMNYALFVVILSGTVIAFGLLILTLYRMKKEANLDQLTGLQNRNTYKADIATLIDHEQEKFGALLFCDIDNLKFINECYGHTSGDRYIQATANIFKEFGKYKSVIARPSGDEFVVYIHGFDSKEDVVTVIDEIMDKARNSYFVTSLQIEEKLRFSTGIAIYPSDTRKVDELIKYADYSMYKMKKNSKGEVAYYDSTTIDQTLVLAKHSGFLDEFIDKELLDFAMQPIVDANTFEIYGYEALMRPQSNTIDTPYLLLELAKAESKLDKIERLVMKKGFEKIKENFDVLKDYKIFINSIADQLLNDEEFSVFTERYSDILSQVVIEVTEQESVDYDLLRHKSDMFKNAGALIAIDDFGAGYSNENSLLNNKYDVIKLDMNLVRNIDTDNRRQQIVQSVINFSNTNNYKILAEGVESENEVRKLRELGIHYMQGYYFGRPEIEIKGVSEQALRFLELENSKK